MPNWVWFIAIILLVLWLLGMVTHFMGGLVNILLVIALIIIIVKLLQGRKII